MKDKKKYDFADIPAKVLYVQMCGAMGTPIGGGLYDEVITEYPEYFPKEAEHKRKWETIPKEVHDAHWKEYWEFHEALWKDEPKSGGLVSMINNDEQYQKWNEAYKRLKPIEEAKEKELHTKHYAQYGI